VDHAGCIHDDEPIIVGRPVTIMPPPPALPVGPRTMKEAHQWHNHNAKVTIASDAEAGATFVENASGATLRGYFSGMDCWSLGLEQQATGYAMNGHPLTEALHIQQVCDINPACRRVLLNRAKAADHIGGNISDRLSAVGLEHIKHAERLNRLDKSRVFGEDDISLLSDTKLRHMRSTIKTLGDTCVERLMHAALMPGSLRHKVKCYKHNAQYCDFNVRSTNGGLLLECSGTMCTPFSTMGLMLGFLDEACARIFCVWLADCIHVRPDVIWHENVPGFVWRVFERWLPRYTVQSRVSCTSLIGLPGTRERRITCCLNDDTVEWKDPATNTAGMTILNRSVVMDGDRWRI
jgi:site-specific DNA-cytosine methylase